MAEHTNFELYRGTAVTLRFQLTTPEPYPNYVNNWTTLFTVKDTEQHANALFTANGALANTPNALQYGIFDVSLTANQTLLLNHGQHYDWSFKRVDAGYEDVLGFGELHAWTVS